MKTPRKIGHEVGSAIEGRSGTFRIGWCGDACKAIASAIERARADGLVAGFRAARTSGEDATAALRELGVSEDVYREAVREANEDERTTT